MPVPKLKANENRTFIYTEDCKLCGHTNAYADIVYRLKELGKDVYVKQTSLWVGWSNEAAEIGLPMPFVLDYDTMNTATVEELDKKTNEELKEWLGIGE